MAQLIGVKTRQGSPAADLYRSCACYWISCKLPADLHRVRRHYWHYDGSAFYNLFRIDVSVTLGGIEVKPPSARRQDKAMQLLCPLGYLLSTGLPKKNNGIKPVAPLALPTLVVDPLLAISVHINMVYIKNLRQYIAGSSMLEIQ